MAKIPTRDLRSAEPLNAFFFAPAMALRGRVEPVGDLLHPPEPRAPAGRAGQGPAPAQPGRVGPGRGLPGHAAGPDQAGQPKLDDLFALPSAAITLEAGTGFKPTGSGSVCFRSVEGRSFTDVQKDVQDLLNMDAGKDGSLPVEVTKDDYGFTWLVSSCMSDQVETLVTDLHAVNSSLVDAGFGPQLLCTLVAFRDEQERRLR